MPSSCPESHDAEQKYGPGSHQSNGNIGHYLPLFCSSSLNLPRPYLFSLTSIPYLPSNVGVNQNRGAGASASYRWHLFVPDNIAQLSFHNWTAISTIVFSRKGRCLDIVNQGRKTANASKFSLGPAVCASLLPDFPVPMVPAVFSAPRHILHPRESNTI
jgi:hypothetical protein